MYIILFCIQLFFIISSLPLSSATMHVLIAGDDEGRIASSVQQDLKKVAAKTKLISQTIGMKHHYRTIKEKNLSSKAILDWIQKSSVRKDDVFIFYFSGHGFLSKKQSKWPSIHFSRPNERLDVRKVVDAIGKKKPKLRFVFCDACNNPMSAIRAKSIPLQPSPTHIFNTTEKKRLQQLFMRSKGTIIACGSRPGTMAWGCSTGGFFTGIFFLQLEEEVKRSSPTWQHLFSTIKKLCHHVQDPVAEVRISSHN
jgi:hypothetical protein